MISLMKKNIQKTTGEQVFVSNIPHIPLMLKIQRIWVIIQARQYTTIHRQPKVKGSNRV